MDCASGGITVSWDPSPNVVGYTAVVSDGTAETSHEITEPMLTIAAQDCGQQYTVSVVSKSLSCVSFPSVFSVSEGKRRLVCKKETVFLTTVAMCN